MAQTFLIARVSGVKYDDEEESLINGLKHSHECFCLSIMTLLSFIMVVAKFSGTWGRFFQSLCSVCTTSLQLKLHNKNYWVNLCLRRAYKAIKLESLEKRGKSWKVVECRGKAWKVASISTERIRSTFYFLLAFHTRISKAWASRDSDFAALKSFFADSWIIFVW